MQRNTCSGLTLEISEKEQMVWAQSICFMRTTTYLNSMHHKFYSILWNQIPEINDYAL